MRKKAYRLSFTKNLFVERFSLISAIWFLFIGMIPVSSAVTPLKFHKHYLALIKAAVVEVSSSYIPTLDTNKLMSGKSEKDSMVLMPIERIHLRVISILSGKTAGEAPANIIKKDSNVGVKSLQAVTQMDFFTL